MMSLDHSLTRRIDRAVMCCACQPTAGRPRLRVSTHLHIYIALAFSTHS